MQSVRAGAVRTYFPFSHFFWKVAPTSPHLGSILETIFVWHVIFGWKKALHKNTSKKLSRQTHTAIKKGLYASPQGPWQAASRTRCSNKKQRVGQLLQYFHTLQSAIWIYNPTIEQITDECCCKGETTTIFRRRVMVKLLQNFRK